MQGTTLATDYDTRVATEVACAEHQPHAEGAKPPAAAASASFGNVAIVHDYLNQRGGAERVVLELSNIWPDATIHTSLYRSASTFPEFRERTVRTTALDRLPVD